MVSLIFSKDFAAVWKRIWFDCGTCKAIGDSSNHLYSKTKGEKDMKVVIIDDEPLISDKLKRIMETGLRGMHMVCAFTDAQTALDYIEQENLGLF